MNKEEYMRQKQQKEQERLRFIRRKKIKKVIVIVLPILSVVVGLVFVLANYSPKETSGTPKIEINPKEYDAGTVAIGAGLVKKTYEIKNVGDGELKISSIQTSCDCTSAILKVGDKESPKFGMHSTSAFWSQEIIPGEIGYLEVIFDPAFHGPHGIGQMLRVVFLSTNDSQNKKVEVRLLANVVH